MALFPFRNPITEATGCLGGIAMHIWTWSGIKCPSRVLALRDVLQMSQVYAASLWASQQASISELSRSKARFRINQQPYCDVRSRHVHSLRFFRDFHRKKCGFFVERCAGPDVGARIPRIHIDPVTPKTAGVACSHFRDAWPVGVQRAARGKVSESDPSSKDTATGHE